MVPPGGTEITILIVRAGTASAQAIWGTSKKPAHAAQNSPILIAWIVRIGTSPFVGCLSCATLTKQPTRNFSEADGAVDLVNPSGEAASGKANGATPWRSAS
jgi:hypothetical protein